MAVTLSSDLVLDVMRGADPARLKNAVSRLAAGQAAEGTTAIAFAEAVDKVEKADGQTLAEGLARSETTSPYVAFEQMFLRNMFESMLPPAASGLYGEGTAGGIWRSMSADQLAGVFARSGGIGIAASLDRAAPDQNIPASRQWPYFEIDEIRAFVG